jgi:drug/metabolite transporter (DMT)-like permease
MTLIWGVNYSIIKVALRELPPAGFNSLRLGLAAALFLVTLGLRRGPDGAPAGRGTIHARDWLALTLLGVIGHFIYQLCFMGGLERTTVANTSLIFGCSPVAVALLSAMMGHERVTPSQWIGVGSSAAGVYLLVGLEASLSATSFAGDLLLLCAVGCWAIYTVGSRSLLERHSPLVVTGFSVAIGTAFYIPVGLPDLVTLDWGAISGGAWLALTFSGVFALFVAYLIWYTAVQRIGNVRTAMYSNITPLVAVLVAVVWLGERLTPSRIAGGLAILLGAALARAVTGAPAGSGPRRI